MDDPRIVHMSVGGAKYEIEADTLKKHPECVITQNLINYIPGRPMVIECDPRIFGFVFRYLVHGIKIDLNVVRQQIGIPKADAFGIISEFKLKDIFQNNNSNDKIIEMSSDIMGKIGPAGVAGPGAFQVCPGTGTQFHNHTGPCIKDAPVPVAPKVSYNPANFCSGKGQCFCTHNGPCINDVQKQPSMAMRLCPVSGTEICNHTGPCGRNAPGPIVPQRPASHDLSYHRLPGQEGTCVPVPTPPFPTSYKFCAHTVRNMVCTCPRGHEECQRMWQMQNATTQVSSYLEPSSKSLMSSIVDQLNENDSGSDNDDMPELVDAVPVISKPKCTSYTMNFESETAAKFSHMILEVDDIFTTDPDIMIVGTLHFKKESGKATESFIFELLNTEGDMHVFTGTCHTENTKYRKFTFSVNKNKSGDLNAPITGYIVVYNRDYDRDEMYIMCNFKPNNVPGLSEGHDVPVPDKIEIKQPNINIQQTVGRPLVSKVMPSVSTPGPVAPTPGPVAPTPVKVETTPSFPNVIASYASKAIPSPVPAVSTLAPVAPAPVSVVSVVSVVSTPAPVAEVTAVTHNQQRTQYKVLFDPNPELDYAYMILYIDDLNTVNSTSNFAGELYYLEKFGKKFDTIWFQIENYNNCEKEQIYSGNSYTTKDFKSFKLHVMKGATNGSIVYTKTSDNITKDAKCHFV